MSGSIYKVTLMLVAALAWFMVVWHVGEGRNWTARRRLVVVCIGGWVLVGLAAYLDL
jgi:hypothetical protein